MSNQQVSSTRPDKWDSVIMMYYNEANLIIGICDENTYHYWKKSPKGVPPPYQGTIEKKVILAHPDFQEWCERKKAEAATRKK